LIRYGGEEILILLDSDFSEALSQLEDFRKYLSNNQLFPEQPSSVRMSFGLAEHESGEDIEETIKRADLALYESKGSGRNRITTYAPYLDYSSRMYVWGTYRYIWDSSIRFCLGPDRMKFLLYWKYSLQWYEWSENKSVYSYIPNECEEPIREIKRSTSGFVILDSEGELWEHIPGRQFEPFSNAEQPGVSQLVGQDDQLRAVGVNNQLYRLEDREFIRECSLPERWDQLVVTDAVYLVVENILIKWSNGRCAESWPLPESPVQVCSSGRIIWMTVNSGRLFKFRPDINRWEQSQFMNLVGGWIPCKEVSPSDNKMLVLDSHGRLLLIKEGGDHKKSVPQEMNLLDPSCD